jgi:hypothetical protein
MTMSFTDALDADWQRFSSVFPAHFEDAQYHARERQYKLRPHELYRALLGRAELGRLCAEHAWGEAAERACKVESASYNLLNRYEKMAFRDALRVPGPHQQRFVQALFELIEGDADPQARFTAYCDAVEALPRQGQARHFSWPVVTLLPFLARPDRHCFLKPRVASAALRRYGVDVGYRPQPNAETYRRWSAFADRLLAELKPRGAQDMIDVNSFLWVIDRYVPVPA